MQSADASTVSAAYMLDFAVACGAARRSLQMATMLRPLARSSVAFWRIGALVLMAAAIVAFTVLAYLPAILVLRAIRFAFGGPHAA